LLDTQEMA